MKPSNWVFLALGILLGFGLATWHAERREGTREPVEQLSTASATCHVLRVIGGDTLRVVLHGREEEVRLLCIDAPERGEPGYEKARTALAKLVGGSRVGLEYEVRDRLERDESERVLAYVYLPDGRCANVEMVRQGWSGIFAGHGRGRLGAKLEPAEAEAKEALRGLWRSEAAEFEELKVLE